MDQSWNGEEVKQLCVVGVATERFWHEAFHQLRGLSNPQWSDVASVNLLDASHPHIDAQTCTEIQLVPGNLMVFTWYSSGIRVVFGGIRGVFMLFGFLGTGQIPVFSTRGRSGDPSKQPLV